MGIIQSLGRKFAMFVTTSIDCRKFGLGISLAGGNSSRQNRRLPGQFRTRPAVEGLEDRCLLSSISGYTEYPVPSGSNAFQIVPGPDGNLWFTEGFHSSKVGSFNPTTHVVSEFNVSTADAGTYGIAAGPDGNVWFTEWGSGKIGMINPTSHAITEFTPPSGGLPKGITTGPDGNIWFVNGGGIGMIN